METVLRDQHFITDRKLLKRIARFSEPRKEETAIEIGAGDGRLTEELSQVFGKVVAIEIDRKFEKHLKKRLGDKQNVKIIFGNVLDMLGKEIKESDKILSNVPYSICEPLFKMLARIRFKKAVLTLPKKFFSRITAKRKEKNYSKLSFFVDSFFYVKPLFSVSRDAFSPQPKTDSFVVSIKPKEKTLINAIFLREKMLLKNALREAFCEIRGLTKREAKGKTKKMSGYLKGMLNKKVRDLTLSEMESLEKLLLSY